MEGVELLRWYFDGLGPGLERVFLKQCPKVIQTGGVPALFHPGLM